MVDTKKYFNSDSPYEKAAEHEGFNKQAIITESGADTLTTRDDKEREIIWLALSCLEKPIVLSNTNGRALRDAFGKNTKTWHDKRVLLTTRRYNIDGNASVGWITTPMLEDDKPEIDPEFDDQIPLNL